MALPLVLLCVLHIQIDRFYVPHEMTLLMVLVKSDRCRLAEMPAY